MQSELQFLSQLSGGGAWLNIAFLIFLAGVLLLKPERIQVKTLFRLSCILFALSLMIPSVVSILLVTLTSMFGPGGAEFYSLSHSFAGVVFGVSVLCGLLSLGGPELDV